MCKVFEGGIIRGTGPRRGGYRGGVPPWAARRQRGGQGRAGRGGRNGVASHISDFYGPMTGAKRGHLFAQNPGGWPASPCAPRKGTPGPGHGRPKRGFCGLHTTRPWVTKGLVFRKNH